MSDEENEDKGLLEKGSLVEEIRYHNGPHYDGNAISLMTFWPANKVIMKGGKKELVRKDVWKLRKDCAAEVVYDKFERQWNKEVGHEAPSLFRALRKTFGVQALQGAFLMILQIILTFTLPLLLPYIIQFLISSKHGDMIKILPNTTPIPDWWGYIYVATVFLSGVVASTSFYHSIMISWAFGLRIRSSLVTLIYRKALYVSSGQHESSGTIVNLMSSDAQIFLDTFVFFMQGFVAPLNIIIAVVLLWLQIGPYALISLAVAVLSFPISAFLGKKVGDYRSLIQVSTDARIKLIKEFILAIRIVKYYAWEKPFGMNISSARLRELKEYRWLHLARGMMLFILLNIPSLGIGFTFFFYGLSNDLDITATFTSLSLLNSLRGPYIFLPLMMSFVGQYAVSLDRIQKFALRENLPPAPLGNHPKGKKGLYIKNGYFSWESETQAKERIIEEQIADLTEKEKNKKRNDQTFLNSIKGEQKIALKKINVKVKEGELVTVVGSVGSGKSSIALSFLGETFLVKGDVYVSSPIAYAAQEAWILNATVRDNILFGQPYDEEWYNKVVDACALRTDFYLFKAGDMSEIGERGANLSGGQKQRINVARAMYSNRDIYIFDDPFSAVDAHVGKHMFHNVVMYLKEQGKTILLVTNQLQSLPFSDRVILIKEGKIKEQGTFRKLMAKGKEMFKLAQEFGVNDEVKTDANAQKNEAKKLIKEEEKEATKKDGQIIQSEESEKGNIGFATYWYYIKSGGLPMFFIIIIAHCFRTATRVGSSIWLSRWSDPKTADQFTNVQYVGVYIGLVFAEALFNLISSLCFVKFTISSSTFLHGKIVRAVSRATTAFFDTTPIGRLLSRFSRDIFFLDMLLPQQFENTLNMFFNLLTILVGVAVGAPYIIIVIFVAMVFYVLLLSFFRKTSIQIQRFESLSRAPLFTHFSETLEGAATIRSYRADKAFKMSNLSMVDSNSLDYYGLRVATQWFGFRLDFLGHCITLLAFLIIVIMRNYTNTLDIGLASLALSYTTGVTVMLSALSTSIAELEVRVNSIERLKEYDHIDEELPAHIPEKLPESSWPSEGKIKFKNLTIEYFKDQPVLKGLNATIKPREKIGIVGRTGAGKSTLITALFRTTEPVRGKIYIDGVNILKLGLTDLRSKLSIIPQISQMFIGTLRYNLDPFDEHEDHDIWKAIEMVGLTKKIQKLGGLTSIVEENGQNFSLGERQLIAMARCLLRNTHILLLDEATAAVDVQTDALIQKMIRQNFGDKTVLTIAHRLNTVMDSDRIMVLDKGEIAEFDKPIVLLQNPNSILSSMVESTGVANAKFLRSIAEGKITVEEAILEESSSEQRADEESFEEFVKNISEEGSAEDEGTAEEDTAEEDTAEEGKSSDEDDS